MKSRSARPTRGASMTSDVLFRIANTGWAESEQWGGVISGVAISDVLLGPGKFVLLGGSPLLGDVNGDGEVNGLDVDPFVDGPPRTAPTRLKPT